MHPNRLLPTPAFAALMLGIALCCFVLAWLAHMEIPRSIVPGSQALSREAIWFSNGFILFGLLLLAPSLGLLARQKWSVNAFMVLFWVIGIVWTTLLFLIFRGIDASTPGRSIANLIVIAALVYAALAAGILYLNKVSTSIPFGGKEAEVEDLPDVLDQ